jgi:hypothetical protein
MQAIDQTLNSNVEVVRDRQERQLLIAFLRGVSTRDIESSLNHGQVSDANRASLSVRSR